MAPNLPARGPSAKRSLPSSQPTCRISFHFSKSGLGLSLTHWSVRHGSHRTTVQTPLPRVSGHLVAVVVAGQAGEVAGPRRPTRSRTLPSTRAKSAWLRRITAEKVTALGLRICRQRGRAMAGHLGAESASTNQSRLIL
jgi:hypothetical protein